MAKGATLKGSLTKRWAKVDARVAKAVDATADALVKDAQARAPVDTGHLKASIAAQPAEHHQAAVTVDTRDSTHHAYGHFVEFGTRNAPAQPYFIPAAEGQRGKHVERVRKALSDG